MSKRDVELIIRARNEASKTVGDVTRSLAELEERQDTLGLSAASADNLLGQLAAQFDALKTVSGSAQAVDKIRESAERAGQAFARQTEQLARSRESYTQLTQAQADAAGKSGQLQTEVEQSGAALKLEAKAASAAKAELAAYAAAQRKAAAASVAAEAALAKARKQYAEKATPVRERKLVDAGIRVAETRKAAQAAALAEAQLTKAYAAQNAELQTSRTTQSAAAKSLLDLQNAEKKLASEVTRTETAVAKQAAEVAASESEYAGLAEVVRRAEQTFTTAAAAQGVLGQSSQKAATELTVLKARMQELQAQQKSGGATAPLIDTSSLNAANLGLREAMTTIRAAGTASTSSAVNLRELGSAVDVVARSGKDMGTLLSAVEKQDAAIKSAKREWSSAEAEVKRLAVAFRATAQPSQQLADAFGRAQGKARAAKDAFRAEEAAAESLGDGLRQAGLQHTGLADAQGQLRARIAANSAALTQGQSRLISYGNAAGRVSNSSRNAARGVRDISPAARAASGSIRELVEWMSELDGEGRQSLSLFQRVRGQMLSIAAASGGIFAVKSAIEGVVQAQQDMDAVQARFTVAFEGDQSRVSAALKMTRDTADELGLSFRTLALEYSKLAAASLGTELEGEKTETIFKGIAEAARVLRLSDDEVAGSFKALTDIMSKGTIMAEELKGQLGDRFPGAVQIMAQALGVGTAELLKMMEQGELTSASLVGFADVMKARVAPGKAEAIVAIGAQLDRLKNSVLDVQLAVAESGFLDELTVAVTELAEALQDPEVSDGFAKVGKFLGVLTRIAKSAITNFEVLATVIGGLAGMIGLRFLMTLGKDMATAVIGAWDKAGKFYGFLKNQLIALNGAALLAGGGLKGMLTVLATGAAWATGFGIIIYELGLIGDAAYDAYKAQSKLQDLQEKAAKRTAIASKEATEALAHLRAVQAKDAGGLVKAQEKTVVSLDSVAGMASKAAGSYKEATAAQTGLIMGTEELSRVSHEAMDAYQEALLARMKEAGKLSAQLQGLQQPDRGGSMFSLYTAADRAEGEALRKHIGDLETEQNSLARAIEASVLAESLMPPALAKTADAVKRVAQTTAEATARADDWKKRMEAVAQVNFDNSIIGLEALHTAEVAALTLSGADEQTILKATDQLESRKLDLEQLYAVMARHRLEADVAWRKQILDKSGADAKTRAESLTKIEEEAAKGRIEIAKREVQAVSAARDQALNRYMSALQRVADLDRRIGDIRMQGEFQINDLRRGAMSDMAAYHSRQREMTTLTGRIEEAVAQGSFEVAESLAQRQLSLAQGLNQEVKDGEKILVSKEKAASNAINGTKLANENLIGVLQKRKDLAKAEAEEQKKLYEGLTSALTQLNRTLARVSGVTEIDLPLNIDENKAKTDMSRAVSQARAVAIAKKIDIPLSADTREYVHEFNKLIESGKGTRVRVGVFLEDGAYKIKVNEMKDQVIVATGNVEFSGVDLDAAIARASEIINGDFPPMYIPVNTEAFRQEIYSLEASVYNTFAGRSALIPLRFVPDTVEAEEARAAVKKPVEIPTAFNPDTGEIEFWRLKVGEMIIVPVKFEAINDMPKRAMGGQIKVPGFATGGSPSGLLRGPGTGTSDSILAAVSNREYVVRAMAVRKYGVNFMDQLNAGAIDPDRLKGLGASQKGPAGGGGDTTSLNLTINGRATGQLSGSRASVQNLVDSLHEIARQTGG